jgi:hypothetical protein
MNSKLLIAAAVGLFISFGAGSANASSVLITITNDDTGADPLPTISFEVAADPTPVTFSSEMYFTLNNIAVTANGLAAGLDDFTFYNASFGGGFSDGNYYNYLGGILGDQIYGGTEEFPTFTPGTYTGTYFSSRLISEDPDATITISAVSATPLPSTWLMLLSGLVGLACFTWLGPNNRSTARPA